MLFKDSLFDKVGELLDDGCPPEKLDDILHEQFGETVAPLVLDSTGFTRITKEYGIGFFLSLIQHLRVMCEKVFIKTGAVHYRAGADNMFAEFKSVDDAVKAAFVIHKHFNENRIALMDKDDNFGACIGIGWGTLLRSDREGVYGREMNYAAKLGEDTADKGETLLTQEAFNSLNNKDNYTVIAKEISLSGVTLPYFSISPK
jgi:adenylate cyclase